MNRGPIEGIGSPRKSRRLAGISPSNTNEKPELSGRQVNGSTDLPETESAERWSDPDLKRQAKKRIDCYVPANRTFDEKLASCMHAFLEWLPEGGREWVARDIRDCTNDESLWRVYYKLVTGLLYPMMTARRQHLVTTPFLLKFMEPYELEGKAVEYEFHKSCLERDTHHCVVTQFMNYYYWHAKGEREDEYIDDLEAVHIIPSAYESWRADAMGPDDALSQWEILYRCFPEMRKTGINMGNIHGLPNALTLIMVMATQFSNLRMALIPTETPSVYCIKTYKYFGSAYYRFLPADRLARFPSQPNHLAPNPVLLDTHYRVAEILNASRVGDEIQERISEWKDLKSGPGHGSFKADGTSNIKPYLDAGFWNCMV